MRALVIIDMQEDYVGESRNKKRFPYNADSLIEEINSRIACYQNNNDKVIYVVNKSKSSPSPLIPKMTIASDLIFEKDKASCFSNDLLLACLKCNSINEIELAGVDGNSCVAISARDGIKFGFAVRLFLSCIGIANAERFSETRKKLLEANVTVIDSF